MGSSKKIMAGCPGDNVYIGKIRGDREMAEMVGVVCVVLLSVVVCGILGCMATPPGQKILIRCVCWSAKGVAIWIQQKLDVVYVRRIPNRIHNF